MNIYTFNAFRENLSDEIKKLEELLSKKHLADRGEKIQAHFCSIAALLRKMIAEVPNYEGKNIRVYEGFDKSNIYNLESSYINLKKLTGKIIHHEKLGVGSVMSFGPPSSPPSDMKYMTVMSDQEDTGVYHREFLTEDFINIAKEVAENDRKVLKHVLLNAIKNLEYDINQNLADQNYREFCLCGHKTYYPVSFGYKVYNSLMYVSDLMRKVGNYKLPNRTIDIFFEVKEGDKIIQVKECNVEYAYIFQHFGEDLRIDLSDRYLETYQNTCNTKLKGSKTITMYGESLEGFEEGKYSKCVIIAKDLLDLLNQSKH